MNGLRMLKSYFQPKPESASGRNRVDPQPAKPTSKEGLPPADPVLRRVKSIPARLSSKVPEQPEVKPARPPITRTEPDNFPPRHFGRSPAGPSPARSTFMGFSVPSNVFGFPLPFTTSTIQGSKLKAEWLEKRPFRFIDLEPAVMKMRPDLAKIVREHSPNYDHDPVHLKGKAMYEALGNHPEFLAIQLHHLNATNRLPTVATDTRPMTPGEQTFLTNALQKVSEDVRNKPFHIHGESAIAGNKNGEITYFNHEPKLEVSIPVQLGDKYQVHTHPPFTEPTTSAASRADHIAAANLYHEDNRQILSYVTNGKDVLHIQPDSTELVKLIPDPKVEEKLGKFPLAFKLPDPETPPYPFSNHEAPGALKSGRLKHNPMPTE